MCHRNSRRSKLTDVMELQLVVPDERNTNHIFVLRGSNTSATVPLGTANTADQFRYSRETSTYLPLFNTTAAAASNLWGVSPFATGASGPVARLASLNEITYRDRTFRLTHPLRIEVSNLLDGWCYESKPLAILAFGRSRQDALVSFKEDFAVLWDAIAQAPEESLTMDAVAVKYAFRAVVEAVVETIITE
jgi:hypothetical protein